jgi:two-component system, cell cycle response regulator
MRHITMPSHPYSSFIQQGAQALRRGPLAWGIILLGVALALLPFVLLEGPGVSIEQLEPWVALCILPLLLAAWLRARSGAMLVCFLLISSLPCISFRFHGLAWMLQVDGRVLFSAGLAFLILACVTGQMNSMRARLAIAYKEVKTSHDTLDSTHRELEAAHATIQQQALTDGLTGLPNHRAVMEQLQKELERARCYGRPFSLLFFDADRFKRVNDTHGHAAGDAVLRQIGERAASALRGGDSIGRFGGEEFIILLPEADASEARVVAERLRATVAADPVATAEVEGGLAVTVSIGMATFLLDGSSEQELLSQADEAMYIAKRLGRNQVRSAEEARHMSADVELMALLLQEEQREAALREGTTPEHLRDTYTSRTICSLMTVLERRDKGLSGHAYAVSEQATTIAAAMGLDAHEVSRIGMAALLHDIGKVAVPDALLQKSTPLSAQEWVLLREHAELGEQILEASPFLYDVKPAVRHHHERWDGCGYPDQLRGEDIPLAARIIAVAEIYDAMQRDLPYQAGCSSEEALAELQRGAGSQFDPAVVQAFSALLADQHRQRSSLLQVVR